ncbi:MAG TPA: hydrolase [Lactobacillus sp.]|nr:hydrolase [Lactobacillus sp.]
MYKTLIYDFDGTIGDTLPICIAAFRKAVTPFLNREITDGEIVSTFGPSEEGTIHALIPDHFDDGIHAYWTAYKELQYMAPKPFDGIRELLDDSAKAGFHNVLVTGKALTSAEISLEQYGLTTDFKLILTGSPKGPNKPENIVKALKETNTTPDEALYIGDAPSDITSSHAANVKIAAALWGSVIEPEKVAALKPDYTCHSVAEFRQIVLPN